MGSTRIVWTPIDHGTGTRTLDLGTHPILFRFQGGDTGDIDQSMSVGRAVVTRTHSSYRRFDVELEGIDPTQGADLFALLRAWWSHAKRGGTFSFALDSAKSTSTLLNGAVSATATAITVDSTTGMTAGDWLTFTAEDEPAVFEDRKILTVDTGTTLTLAHGLTYNYPDNSPVRHQEYFPTCVVVPPFTQPFVEREAGKGPNKWDLAFTLETVA